MEGLDVVRAVVRWVHAVAATTWVGGSVFYLVVLRPALATVPASNKLLEAAINRGFRDVIDVAIVSLIVSGVFITVDRFSSIRLSTIYFAVLALKLAVVVAMLFMARDLGTRTGRLLKGRRPSGSETPAPAGPALPVPLRRRWLSPSRLILALGLVAFFLSMLLMGIYERELAGVA